MTVLSIPNRKMPDPGKQDNSVPDSAPPQSHSTETFIPARQERSRQTANVPSERALRKKRAVYYPTGDGKPMAEDVLHRKLMAYCCDALEQRFAHRADVLVAGNDFVYYEEGNPKARISPDCYVCMGVEPRGIRHFYKIWEENNIAPSVVIELTSKKTQKEDVTIKRPLYEQTLRVQEYFQFDPTGDYLHPRLQGQRLQDGVYHSIELRNDRMTSEQLGLELVIEGETLRLFDPATSEFLRTYAQAETQRLQEAQRAEQEAQRAEQEARRAKEAEAEIDRLRHELEALRRQK